MAEDEDLLEEHGQNLVLQEAIEALRKGDRVRARDILTRLLKTDQNNAMCWIWLSTAVETSKERLYCLQTALQLDPQNASAKRGLIMLGGLPPDDSVPPFPLNRSRMWEEQLTIPEESAEHEHSAPRQIGRTLFLLAAGLVVLAIGYFGFLAPNAFALAYLNKPRFHHVTATITIKGTIHPTPLSTLSTLTPLAQLLKTTYTPTALYVLTPHPLNSQSDFNAGLRFFEAHDYENSVKMFNQVLVEEPQAIDAFYYIGESYRMRARQASCRAIPIR